MPTVSVIIPNYNYAPYLKERINSVLNQTFQDFEVIILDDKSTDNSRDIIELYRNHPKVSHTIYNEENSGSTFKQWNKGIELAKSEWIWIAESDDTAEITFLETLISETKKNKNIVLAYCQSSRMNSNGEKTGDWLKHTQSHIADYSLDFFKKGKDFILEDLFYRNVIPNASAVIFKRSIFLKAQKADEDIRYNSDWLLWMKLLLFGDVYFCSQRLNNFRYHNNSVIANSSRNEVYPFKKRYDIIMMEKFLTYLKIFNKEDLLNPFKNQIKNFNELEFRFLFAKGYRKTAMTYARKALSLDQLKIYFILRNIRFMIKNIK